MNPANNHCIDYIEFAARDVAAAKKFYTAAFGWRFTDHGPDYTSFSDRRLNGGFFASTEAAPKSNPLVVIFAASLEDAEKRVIAAGGKITRAAYEFPGGRRFHFTDPNGLELAVWSDRRLDGTTINEGTPG